MIEVVLISIEQLLVAGLLAPADFICVLMKVSALLPEGTPSESLIESVNFCVLALVHTSAMLEYVVAVDDVMSS